MNGTVPSGSIIPLDFFQMLLCYSLNLKWFTFRFGVTGLHKLPHNVKVEICFSKLLQIHLKKG
jgi:hypothetical protein